MGLHHLLPTPVESGLCKASWRAVHKRTAGSGPTSCPLFCHFTPGKAGSSRWRNSLLRDLSYMPILYLLGRLQQNTIHWGTWEWQKFISHSLEAGKSKIQVWADLVLGESPLPGLEMALFSKSSQGREARELSGVSLRRDSTHSWGICPHDFITSPKLPPPNTITQGVRISTRIWRGTHTKDVLTVHHRTLET